ncbi:MAG: S-layer homology domain-containing protein [Proteocatella sp.]
MSFKKLISLSVIFTLLSTPAAFADSFKDTASAKWAQPSIDKMVEKGYVGGFPDGTFRPSANISRAELIAIINKMNGFTQEASVEFKDVKHSHWAYSEIRKAIQAGYVSGMPDGTFQPNTPVTREQAATIINNLYKFENNADGITIKDQNKLSPWASDAVSAILANGIMGGYPDGTFGGKKLITRAECIVVLDRVIIKNHLNNGNSPATDIAAPAIPVIPATDVKKPEATQNTTGGGGGGGGGGGSTAPSTPNVPTKDVVTSLNNVVSQMNSYVAPKLKTDLQKNTADIMTKSMTSYISNSKYSIDGDIETAKSNIKNMTEKEAKEFKDTITGNVLVKDLQTLNDFFKLVEY